MLRVFLSAAALVLCLAQPATAQMLERGESHWAFGAGAYNVNDNEDGGVEADFRAEYRSGWRVLKVIRPYAGLEITSEGSFWAGAGLGAELPLGQHWFIGASFAPGVYAQGGSDLDLGHTIEFRSQAEVGYRFDSGRRLSLAYSHTSNASMDDDNPGAESVMVYYHVPF